MAAFANLVAQNARVDFSLREENCLAVLINLQMQNVVRKKKKIKTLPPKIQALIYLLNLYYLLLFFYYSLNPITNNINLYQGPGSSRKHYEGGSHGGTRGGMDHTMSERRGTSLLANGGCHTSQCRSGGGAGRIAGGASRIAVNCSNQNSWKDNGKCGERINICIPNFKDMTLGLLDKFSTPGTTKQVTYGKSALRNIDRIVGLHTASIDTIINRTSNVNGIQFRSAYMDKEFSVGFMPEKDEVESNGDDVWLQDDIAPSLIKKISRHYVYGLRLNNDNYSVVIKTSSKKFPSGKNSRIDIQMWDYNAELLNMKYLFRSPITNCYNKVFPCEFTGTYEAYSGDSTEEGHGGHGAPGTIYENCGDVNDRLTISNNHPNNRIVVPDGKTYLVNKANTSRKKLAATLITELRLMNNARVGFEPLKLGRGSNAHLDIGYLLEHKTGTLEITNKRTIILRGYIVDVLASAVFNLATNPSVADGRNTIFDRGKKILCPHILTALSSNRRCGQDTLY